MYIKASIESLVNSDGIEIIDLSDKNDVQVVLYETNGGDCVYVDVYKGEEGLESWHFTQRQMDEAISKFAELTVSPMTKSEVGKCGVCGKEDELKEDGFTGWMICRECDEEANQ